ncbi:MAG: winged helix-turn-helix transcriptional regulator [Synergistetes bacterium]|nr:winged helix-turn-helix transcriptional regulator [Synergistota bacterium]
MVKIHYETVAKYFGALSHPLRIQIIEKLMNGDMRLCQLAEDLGVEKGYLSRHINILKKFHLVSSYIKDGKTHYRLECTKSIEVIEKMKDLVEHRYSVVLDSIKSVRGRR